MSPSPRKNKLTWFTKGSGRHKLSYQCCVQQSERPRTFADWAIENDVRAIVQSANVRGHSLCWTQHWCIQFTLMPEYTFSDSLYCQSIYFIHVPTYLMRNNFFFIFTPLFEKVMNRPSQLHGRGEQVITCTITSSWFNRRFSCAYCMTLCQFISSIHLF